MMRDPRLTDHPILVSMTFHVQDCPVIEKEWRGKVTRINPCKVVVEMRPRGTRVFVYGDSTRGIRGSVFNASGYPRNPPAPEWLKVLIAEAERRWVR